MLSAQSHVGALGARLRKAIGIGAQGSLDTMGRGERYIDKRTRATGCSKRVRNAGRHRVDIIPSDGKSGHGKRRMNARGLIDP